MAIEYWPLGLDSHALLNRDDTVTVNDTRPDGNSDQAFFHYQSTDAQGHTQLFALIADAGENGRWNAGHLALYQYGPDNTVARAVSSAPLQGTGLQRLQTPDGSTIEFELRFPPPGKAMPVLDIHIVNSAHTKRIDFKSEQFDSKTGAKKDVATVTETNLVNGASKTLKFDHSKGSTLETPPPPPPDIPLAFVS